MKIDEKMNESKIVRTTQEPEFFVKEQPSIYFNSASGKIIGELQIIDEQLVFSGDTSESAKILFKEVCRMFNTKTGFCSCDKNSDLYTVSITKCSKCHKEVDVVRM
jgi:hypothetical protein